MGGGEVGESEDGFPKECAEGGSAAFAGFRGGASGGEEGLGTAGGFKGEVPGFA